MYIVRRLQLGTALWAGSAARRGAVDHGSWLTTSFTRDSVAISITGFAGKRTINGGPVELVYTKVSVPDHGSAAVAVPAGQSGPGLVMLNQAPDTALPGVPDPGSYPIADNAFNQFTFDPVTTTKLRVVPRSGLALVGFIQPVVPPASPAAADPVGPQTAKEKRKWATCHDGCRQ
jgi:hypothetical protein